jgi:antitoxin component YwqK of YwqJK toxin-antitoxin module
MQIIQKLPIAIFFLGILSLLTSCKSNTKENLLRYNDGKIMRRYTTVDDKIEGQMQEFYPDGKLKIERFFQNGLQTGRATVYYPDGKIKETQYFDNGKQSKGDTIYYTDGRIQFVVSFKDGKKDGFLRKWTPDSELFYEARYEMDVLKEVKGRPIIQDSTGNTN